MVKKLQPTSQTITQKNLNQNKNTSQAERFFHHHSPAKFSNSTQKKELEKRSSLGVRQQTHHNYLPTKTTYLLPKPPTYHTDLLTYQNPK
jgi:hypothetical protein